MFVAGDFRYGGEDIISAVEDGKQAAFAIDENLMAERYIAKHVAFDCCHTNGETGRVRDHDL